jgi:cell division transport system ATP-binding protein
MIVFDGVTKIYNDDTKALDDVNIKIEPKEFVSIVGHSGAGKTSLVKMLLAEDSPTEGKVLFESMEAAGATDEEILSDVPYSLELVGLTHRSNNFPSELSGGEQQRVAIARALVNRPDVIVADEPTGNLDPLSTYEIIQILQKVNDLGTTIILTTHDKGVIDELGKRVITMEDGKVIRDDATGKYVL